MHNVIVVLPPTHISIKLNLLYKLPVCDNCSDCFTYPFTSGREREGGIGEGGREGGGGRREGRGGEGRRGEERGWREEGRRRGRFVFELQDGLTTDKDGEYKHQQLSELSITMHAVCENLSFLSYRNTKLLS